MLLFCQSAAVPPRRSCRSSEVDSPPPLIDQFFSPISLVVADVIFLFCCSDSIWVDVGSRSHCSIVLLVCRSVCLTETVISLTGAALLVYLNRSGVARPRGEVARPSEPLALYFQSPRRLRCFCLIGASCQWQVLSFSLLTLHHVWVC
ncbi:uncharacterized protein G2W53_003401 [Senna tora]|uniref:Uncharacterized protein n=1 Tax=Senna tora TaxID=362788 RepID=A0A834X8U0_9FABA|nr:uncharacterized protein G2W53_003401 [Senna tora]